MSPKSGEDSQTALLDRRRLPDRTFGSSLFFFAFWKTGHFVEICLHVVHFLLASVPQGSASLASVPQGLFLEDALAHFGFLWAPFFLFGSIGVPFSST